MAVAVVPGFSWALSRLGGNRRRKSAGRSTFEPGSSSMAPIAAVLPTLKICTMPVCTPELADNSGDRVGQVVHLAAAVRVQRQFPLEEHAIIIVRLLDFAKPPERHVGRHRRPASREAGVAAASGHTARVLPVLHGTLQDGASIQTAKCHPWPAGRVSGSRQNAQRTLQLR